MVALYTIISLSDSQCQGVLIGSLVVLGDDEKIERRPIDDIVSHSVAA